MRIKILSDLHIDYNSRSVRSEEYLDSLGEGNFDTVILAGDTAEGLLGLDWAERVFDGKKIIFVPGNHEYYHQNIDELDHYFAEDELVYNNRTLYEYTNNVRFICSTLWTDFNLYKSQQESRLAAAKGINDFRIIGGFDTKRCLEKFRESFEYIEQELQERFDGTTILVVHFGVSHDSVHMKYLGSNLNPYFHSDITTLFRNYKVDYCIHGHTHSSRQYELHGTKVICNPFGYYSNMYGPENPEFNPNLILEI